MEKKFKNLKNILDKEILNNWLKISNLNIKAKNANKEKYSQAIKLIKSKTGGLAKSSPPYIEIENIDIDKNLVKNGLNKLKPWRKGPFLINKYIKIESEWQCDMKWQRIINNISPIKGNKILDVGANNGYFTLRMALEGADIALGIEPFILFNYQFKAIKSLISNCENAYLLPIRLEDMESANIFDKVFSMGVLYHQRDHLVHLTKLKQMLNKNGELILETLIVDGEENYSIKPKKRYARMRNVYCIPSIEKLKKWLKKAQFKQIKVINICQTTIKEQRNTKWLGDNPKSLQDFLDPLDYNLTIEGYPAPKRVIITAKI